ncbi:hypothetical protein ACI1US_00928 [Leucobacter sp. BZR 635]
MTTQDPVSAQTNSDKLNAPRQRYLYLVAAIAQGGGAIAVQPFAIRMMSAEEWGKASFMLSLIAIALVAITAGLPLALGATYFDPERGVQKARALNGFGSAGSLLLGAIAALVVVVVSGASGGTIGWLYLFAILSITMHGVSQMNLAFLRSEGRAGSFVVVIVLATVVGHVFGLASMVVFAPTAEIYLGSFSIAVLAAAVLGVALTKPAAPFSEPTALKLAATMALPVLPHSLALIVMQQGESVLLAIFQGEAVVGRYNAVMPFALGAIAVILALGNVWQAVLLSLRGESGEGKSRVIQREAFFVAFLLTVLVSGAATFATYVLVDKPQPELFQLAKLFPLVGVGYAGFLVASSQMFAIGRTVWMSVITPVTAVAMLAVAAIPARSGDLFAVGIVKVVAYLLLGLVFVLIARRYGRELVDLKAYLLSALASAAVVILLLLTPVSFGWGLALLAAGIVVAGLLGVLYLKRSRRA